VRDAGPPARAVFRVVSPGYHTVLQSPILAGRDFTSADDAGRAPVAIVNDTMARLYWPNGGAVGQTLRLLARSGRDDPQTPRRHDLVRVIGVVADSKQVRVIEAPVRPEMFLPLQQFPEEARGTAILVRTAGDPSAAAGAVRAAVAGVDRDMPIFDVETMDDVVADAFGPKRLTLVLLLFFGVVAVGLASVGLYGIVSFAVEQRTRELSVRVAIGAQARAIVLLVLRDAAAVTAAGVVAGVAAALVLTRLMRSELSGVSATDPASFVAVSILLLAVTLAAAALPACRAARVDPLISLRAE
jgi:putative ABC transport system permease protein